VKFVVKKLEDFTTEIKTRDEIAQVATNSAQSEEI
jgi:hypothetical protein